jgi:hypothetical protein
MDNYEQWSNTNFSTQTKREKSQISPFISRESGSFNGAITPQKLPNIAIEDFEARLR